MVDLPVASLFLSDDSVRCGDSRTEREFPSDKVYRRDQRGIVGVESFGPRGLRVRRHPHVFNGERISSVGPDLRSATARGLARADDVEVVVNCGERGRCRRLEVRNTAKGEGLRDSPA
jgi:hypothetical protein